MAQSDMFLAVEGAKSGTIKGETNDQVHVGEIDVVGWSWGMRSQTELSGGGPAGKASMRELVIRKKVDSASTALMSALRNNEQITSAVLSVRKAGGSAIDFLVMTIENGRLTSIDVGSADDGSPDLVEQLSFSFQKVTVEYVPQTADGLPAGGMLFETETI